MFLGTVSYFSMQDNEGRIQDLKDTTFVALRTASQQSNVLGQIHSASYAKIAIAGSLTEAELASFGKQTSGELDKVASELGRLKDMTGANEAALALPMLAAYRAGVAQALDLASMDANTGVAAMQSADSQYQKMRAVLDKVVGNLNKQADLSLQDAKTADSRAVWIILIVMGVGSLVLLALTGAITRAVLHPIADACAAAERLAAGDLATPVEMRRDDEMGALSRALSTVIDNWTHLLTDIRTAGHTITQEASEIAQGNADLSARTESQASSLEETAASMHELTDTVRENADHAQQANQLVVSASDVAVQGGQVMEQMVGTMASIKESSARVVDIISLIDSIAFQTNILALNAAVEAARAGEQGRGFAVVATEVRGLAQRSAQAAREIKDLIDDSVAKVETGSKLADTAGQTMGNIVTSVRHVTEIMNDISVASRRQTQGIEEVNSAITEMDDLTQRNAALVEQAAAAAQSMREQAHELLKAVSSFQLPASAGANNVPEAGAAAAAASAPTLLQRRGQAGAGKRLAIAKS
ncbi:HAMP domain-containing protein [Pseudoduganella danionis]|uniref:HAMP domain-containing protein n=2 Tax=Pseudoduganella danionis TaxID=1890295 RepID=A0ABW9STA7_9BURK|nr:HAMP domain-containing protein [Pseudoduganella danionis]